MTDKPRPCRRCGQPGYATAQGVRLCRSCWLAHIRRHKWTDDPDER